MTNDLFDLTGRVAVVTGGSSGLGREIAVGLAQYGADVAVGVDRNLEGAEQTAEMVRKEGRKALALRVDVRNEDGIKAFVTKVVGEFGRIDILVNSAGVTNHIEAENYPMEEWDRIHNVDLRGLFMCCKWVAKQMIKQGGGSIINLSSIGGVVALGRGNSAFCAAKGGVDNLTRELAIEWAKYGIRVNALAPCQFRTAGLQAVLDDPVHATGFTREELWNLWVSNIPLGRIGEAKEIVGPAVFLASPASSMVTGHILAVDGGYLAR